MFIVLCADRARAVKDFQIQSNFLKRRPHKSAFSLCFVQKQFFFHTINCKELFMLKNCFMTLLIDNMPYHIKNKLQLQFQKRPGLKTGTGKMEKGSCHSPRCGVTMLQIWLL